MFLASFEDPSTFNPHSQYLHHRNLQVSERMFATGCEDDFYHTVHKYILNPTPPPLTHPIPTSPPLTPFRTYKRCARGCLRPASKMTSINLCTSTS